MLELPSFILPRKVSFKLQSKNDFFYIRKFIIIDINFALVLDFYID